MATSHFPLKNCFLFGLLYTVSKIYNASAQVTQPPPSIHEPPSIPLPRWPIVPKGPPSGYHVLPEYAQQKIRKPAEIAHPPPPDSILRTEVHKNPFRPQQSNTFNPHATSQVFKQEASWMPQQRNQYPKDRSIQGPSNNPAYNNYPYKPQYPNGYSKYEPSGPPSQNRMPARFDHHTPAKVNQPHNNGYTYPQPPPGYYGPEKQESKPISDIPQAILEYLQKQKAKDGLPPSLLNYLHSQAGEPVPQSVQESTTPVSPVEVSTASIQAAPQQNHPADHQPKLPRESSTESPTAMTTDHPTTPVVESTTSTAAEELMAKLSNQLVSQSAAVQELTDSFTTLSPLEASTAPTNNSDAVSLQFRKLLLKKLIARRLLTLKTIGNLSKNTTTVAPPGVSESVTTTSSIQHHLAQEPAHKPHAPSAESQTPHGSQRQGNAHQQSLPPNPAFESHYHQTSETTTALNDPTTTMSPGLLPGERFPPNSHYVGHLPVETMAGSRNNQANNQFQPSNGHQQFNAQRPNTYKGNPHFGNQQQKPMSSQNAARKNIQTKTASASGIPEISYVHSGQQNRQAGASLNPDTPTQRSKSFDHPASAQKGLGQVTEPTPTFGAPNEMQTIIIPAMNNPTAKPGMVRVVYIPGKGGAKGFFRVIHVSAPGTPNPSTSQPLSPIQKYFSQDKLNNQQFPTPEQLRHAIKQENMVKSRKEPSRTQHGSKVLQHNPVFETQQKFPAVDSTPLRGSQTNVKDSLVGLLNTLEPTKATKGNMPSYNQQKQAPNQWNNYAPPGNGYIQNQANQNTIRFDTKYQQMNQNSNVTSKTVPKMQEPHQPYQESKNFQQGNKKQGPEMGQHSPNLEPYYKLVEEQIRQNTILTTVATPTTTTPKQIPTQFGYNNAPYGAPWESHHRSNGNQHNPMGPFNHPSRVQEQVVKTTEQPTTPVPVQNFETGSRLSAHNPNGFNMVNQQPQGPVPMGVRTQSELTGAVKGTSASINVPGNSASHSEHIKQSNNVDASSNLGPTARDPAASAAQGTNTAGTVQDHLVQQTMMELLKRQPHLLQGNNLQELINKLSQNMSVPVIDNTYNLNEKASAAASSSSAMATGSPSQQSPGVGHQRYPESNTAPVPSSSAMATGSSSQQSPGVGHQRYPESNTAPVPSSSAMATGSSSQQSPGVGHQRYPESKAAPFENRPQTQPTSSHPVPNEWNPANANGAQNSHSEQLIQANNLQDLINKLSQNMPSEPSSSAKATPSNAGQQGYPESNAGHLGNRPETQPASSHQWNPVNANGAHNPHSGQHRNMNQYHQGRHMGVYHYQGYEVPTTTTTITTEIPTTTQPLPENTNNQHQHTARYDTYGPQSQYPLRGPQRNFPIPIFEHTVLDKLKPQQSKPLVQPQPENSQWKQQQHNHTMQQQNYLQQPAQATNNQQQNHWQQQPSPAANNQQQQPSPADNNQQQQPISAANNQQQQPSPAANNQQQQPSPAANNQQQQPSQAANNQQQQPSQAANNQQQQPSPAANNQQQQPSQATNNQQQQNHTNQQQNQWQQPPQATNNQQQQNHTNQQQNQWQQPPQATNNQQQQNHTNQQQNQWQQPPKATNNNQQQQNHWQQPSSANNQQQQHQWQQPSPAKNQQQQNQWQQSPQSTNKQQQQNKWQQPPQAAKNQQQQNKWQQPPQANNNQQQHNQWQQPPQANNNQQLQNHWQQPTPVNNQQQQNQSSVQHNNHWQQHQHHGSQQQNQMHPQQKSTNQHQQNIWQQQQNQTIQYQHQPYWQTQQNQTNQNYHQTNQQQAHQQYPRNQYQAHTNQQQHQQYYQMNQHKQMHPQQNNQQAPASFHQNKHTGYISGNLHHSQSSVVEAKPLQIRLPGNVNLGAPQSSMTAGSYQGAQIQNGRTTSSPLVDTLSLQRSPLVDPVSPSGGVPDLTAGLPKIIVSFPGGGVSPGSDVLGILDPQLLSSNPNPVQPGTGTSAPPTTTPMTVAPTTTTTMMPTTTIPPAHTFSSELMCTMQSECEMGCCYNVQGEVLWDWKYLVEPPHLPQVGYCHTKTATKLGDGCEANFCPCASANQVCLSVPPENFTMPAGYDAAEQGAISFGTCRSTAQEKAVMSHMTQAKMLVDMCMSDPSCPLHSMQLKKKKK